MKCAKKLHQPFTGIAQPAGRLGIILKPISQGSPMVRFLGILDGNEKMKKRQCADVLYPFSALKIYKVIKGKQV